MGAVLGKDGPQVAFTEDQDAVGELGPDGEDEALGEAVGPRAPWQDLHDVDARTGNNVVEGVGELAGAVAHEEPDGGGAVVEGWCGAARRPRAAA